MGQKTNPIGNRLGIIRGWESNWYGGNDYGDKLAEDDKIRKYVHARLAKASVSRVIIERTLKLITIYMHTHMYTSSFLWRTPHLTRRRFLPLRVGAAYAT